MKRGRAGRSRDACLLVLAAMLSLRVFTVQAGQATMIPAFAGGVTQRALLANPSAIFRISSDCYARHNDTNDGMAESAQACIKDGLRQAGASDQALAFARYAPVPATIVRFINYGNASAVYADMRWADGASGWCLISKSGAAVGLWQPLEIDHDRQFLAFAAHYPGVTAWMPTGPDGPQVRSRRSGMQRFIFKFSLKTCHACAIVGAAKIGFDFDPSGKYSGDHLLAITASPPPQ